ncbi:multiple sugar transport system ATP-binding protein [Cohaesibacter sp. ES.047]|uniref:ABC transporter ATP-binding protein n=1 Tax=Cohaesibacter sp. ES.047 TaxID=1798205 RepID=UPI000BB6B9F7|nr:sn-glycerol-3-phosphate ABC transporter ATP-binding protein UgpC [Cohaesibacter sp. ES.047]SNY91281.1 multiple sugar transport system ATP-binding protein [Cohaesibacter sp. ES.047]
MSATIDINNITKTYGALTVLDDISLHIKAGEFIVFLGPSGCGKSTLLRMIAGLEAVDNGTISIGEERIDTLPPGKRGVAMVFQTYALYPHMTVAQNMAFGLENIKISKSDIDARVKEAAETLEMAHLLDRKPAKLSGGQRQRVAIGRAIVKEPKAFLFDEPLSNLDAALRSRTRLELAQLHQRLGSTMIFVTHDQVEAMTLAHRIVVMHDKKIEQIGTPMEIYQRPATRFVASFVGSPAMSILPVKGYSPQGNGVTLDVDGLGDVKARMRLPADFNLNGATVGARSEDTFVLEAGKDGYSLSVTVVERLGERTLLYGTLSNGLELIVEDSGRSMVKAGDVVQVGLDETALHVFDGNGKAYHSEEEANG